MKPKEFSKIMSDFVEEDKRWRALEVGGIIYDEQSRGMENDYHKMKIMSINLEEREVYAQDVVGTHVATLGYFLTEAEFNKMFNPLIKN